MTRPVILNHRKPLASGSTRAVYLHPDDPDLLIKVMRPDIIEQRYGAGRPWYKSPRRYRQFMSYMREVREEIAMRAFTDSRMPKSVQRVVGFVDTDLGFGLVVEAVRGRDGNLAPSLRNLIRDNRFDAKAMADLDACLAELLELPVVLGDLNRANLVYAWTKQHGEHFVVIDGIGCKTLIPVNRMSEWINRFTKRRLFARLKAGLDDAVVKATSAESQPASLAHAAE